MGKMNENMEYLVRRVEGMEIGDKRSLIDYAVIDVEIYECRECEGSERSDGS